MQHAEKPAPESKPQRIGRFRLIKKRCVIQRQLAQRIPEVLIVVRIDCEDTGVNLRLHTLKTGQSRRFLMRGRDQRVAHRGTFNVFDPRDDKANLTRLKASRLGAPRSEYANQIRLMLLAG